MDSTMRSGENHPQVSAIHCGPEQWAFVQDLGPEIRPVARSMTVPREASLPSDWHIAVYHSDGLIFAFGIGRRVRRVSDLDARFEVLCARRLSHPDKVNSYRFTLGKVLNGPADTGTLQAARVESFLSLLQRSNDREAQDLTKYRDWVASQTLTGDRAKQLGLEKDVLLTLFDIANLDNQVLTDWSPNGLSDEAGFVAGLPRDTPAVVAKPREPAAAEGEGKGKAAAALDRPTRAKPDLAWESQVMSAAGFDPFPRNLGQSVLEDELILADMFHQPGLRRKDSEYTSWHRFQNPSASQVLHVMYANRGRVERETGVDLVYYNESHKSYVCVQYKVMIEHQVNGWEYRPNEGLRDELRRMERLDLALGDPALWFDVRLFPMAGFVKLCEQHVLRPASRRMTEGMYSVPGPRAHSRA